MRASHDSRELPRQPAHPTPADVAQGPAARGLLGAPWAALFAAAVPFFVYLRTMAPTVYGLDSAELTTGSYVLGIVHSPGSPTFLLLGHLFTWLPVGDVGYRVNLLSVTAASLAIALFCAALLRLLREPIVALAGSWLLAFTYYFWVSALAAELYSLQALFLAALTWLSLRWRTEQRPWQLYLFALCFALGLGNHLSLAVAAPGFVVLLRSEERHALPSLRQLAVAAAWGLVGASVYAYLPLRSQAPMNYARALGVDVASWQGFWWMLTGQMFASEMFAVPIAKIPGEVVSFVLRLFSNFVGVIALLGIPGLLDGFRRRPDVHLGLATIFLGHLVFVVTYDVADKELMLVPTFLIWAIWIALGAGVLARGVFAWTNGRIAIPVGALLLMLAVGNLAINFQRVDLSNDWSARRRGEALFAFLPPRAAYVGSWGDVPILEYLRLVEGRRKDVEVLNVVLANDRERSLFVERRLRSGTPVFAGERVKIRDVNAIFEHVAACDCYRLRAQRTASEIAPPDGQR
jgi:hypothetical protein